MAAHFAQIQARFWAAWGRVASNSGVKVALTHQHGSCVWPVSRSISMAHWLAAPQSGQRVGSRGGAVFIFVPIGSVL
jgi:hypothetical protein